jgi:Bardet-Biedl syndrome 7 protein
MVAQVLRYKIKPLNLHCRLEDEFVPPEGHSMNTLRLTGSFNTNLIHEWVSARIPEVPPRIDSETGERLYCLNSFRSLVMFCLKICSTTARLSFQNKFTGSLLTCEYSKGNACFRSDSATTIAILRESFAREAASRRISLSDQLEVDQGSIAVFLERLYPKLDAQYLLVRQVSLINAIKEISAQDDQGAVWLSPEYRQILENADRIQKQHREQPQALQYIWGVITDLFVDWHRLNGRDVRSRLPEIQNFLLRRQDMNSLLTFFEGHF